MWIQNIAHHKEKLSDLSAISELRMRRIKRLEAQLERYKKRMLEVDPEFVTGQK